MKQIFLDYFVQWTTGRLGRTRFFALSVGLFFFMMFLAVLFFALIVNLGIFDMPNMMQDNETLASAASQGSQGLWQNVGFVETQTVQHQRIMIPAFIQIPLAHLLFANITMKRLRDMNLQGGWFYVGTHAALLIIQFIFGAPALGGILLFFFVVLLFVVPTDGFK